MYRKEPLAIGEFYHVFNKSIAGFKIFNNESEYLRIIVAIRYYQCEGHSLRLSDFLRTKDANKHTIDEYLSDCLKNKQDKLVDIVSYCIMPTHTHFILKQLKDNGISLFMNNIFNSYTKYFNIKHKRKGPLWEGRFKNVLIKTDEQLLHLTRYIHLNPVTAYLTDIPESWIYSSYKEYILEVTNRICRYENVINIAVDQYKKFVNDMIGYQRDLAAIKQQILE
ncbi:MAG: hypothetical protein A2Y00_09910 [Omnitrophica WOR_2 bacterium GWF2_43_52]|nr:MAG: hypothetical protein A2062_04240 [Omnitrophica WOR_2 bacterium GWA2_44_7]OGX21545.1 MAG: hypothetical protein A2Y00_09910 [Omnitrophica WOR_2 bacterium GWF2_43_52]OGX53612.1 MAG: hypothetical protein A2460_00710 [Omnitrophica WOR_2 bacterium RIFOXYC2_FULL_43_9]HAH19430.1 hypothetical protein [Candidatus Omnitrophota bacterium]HBG63801.1 hypothetical protein [Candidatus Omnitrophota bacterium]